MLAMLSYIQPRRCTSRPSTVSIDDLPFFAPPFLASVIGTERIPFTRISFSRIRDSIRGVSCDWIYRSLRSYKSLDRYQTSNLPISRKSLTISYASWRELYESNLWRREILQGFQNSQRSLNFRLLFSNLQIKNLSIMTVIGIPCISLEIERNLGALDLFK